MNSISAPEELSPRLSQSHVLLQKDGTATKSVVSHLNTVIAGFCETIAVAYLITESNIKGYGLSVVSFAIFGITSGCFASSSSLYWHQQDFAFMHTALYTWLFLFYFDLGNQKDPESVEEDRVNKPWRAIPSGRLTVEEAERWHFRAILILTLCSSLWLGGFPEAVVFMVTSWLHDAYGLSNSPWGKNLCNCVFFMSGNLGGSRVAAQAMGLSLNRSTYEWSTLVGLAILTTAHVQDLRDQVGDGARGRCTVPILLGDGATRMVTAVLVLAWSLACPMYWVARFTTVSWLSLLIGCYMSARMLCCRSVKDDRLMFHWYALIWLPVLYSVPLLSQW